MCMVAAMLGRLGWCSVLPLRVYLHGEKHSSKTIALKQNYTGSKFASWFVYPPLFNYKRLMNFYFICVSNLPACLCITCEPMA